MLLTKKIFDQIPDGEIFRIVTTKIQNVHKPMEAELTFIAKKGDGYPDWTIYCHHSHHDIEFIKEQGDKVMTRQEIQSICPCDEEVYRLYRF